MRNRYTKYVPQHGYVTVGGNVFNTLSALFSRVPSGITEAVKDGAIDVAKSGIRAAGDRIGTKLANAIKPATKLSPQETRQAVLKELKLVDDLPKVKTVPAIDQYGFGRKRKIRGAGIKLLS